MDTAIHLVFLTSSAWDPYFKGVYLEFPLSGCSSLIYSCFCQRPAIFSWRVIILRTPRLWKKRLQVKVTCAINICIRLYQFLLLIALEVYQYSKILLLIPFIMLYVCSSKLTDVYAVVPFSLMTYQYKLFTLYCMVCIIWLCICFTRKAD